RDDDAADRHSILLEHHIVELIVRDEVKAASHFRSRVRCLPYESNSGIPPTGATGKVKLVTWEREWPAFCRRGAVLTTASVALESFQQQTRPICRVPYTSRRIR